MTTPRRTGAVRIADVPPDILAALNAGELETATLAECLAIDQMQLVRHVFPTLQLERRIAALESELQQHSKLTAMRATRIIAADLASVVSPDRRPRSTWTRLRGHPSDTVRGWAAFVIGLQPDWSLADRLAALQPLAADPHFGVREAAWLAVRDSILAEIEHAISQLTPWAGAADPLLRRFASEATRPRGVWCAHSDRLKAEPELGLPILEPLKNDDAKYVRDSVGNWLNDAAKSRPDWVREICARWSVESPTKATAEIAKRAQRSLPTRPVG